MRPEATPPAPPVPRYPSTPSGVAACCDVVVVDQAGEDAGAGAAQRGRVDPGALERLPGGLQQQPLLRVHRQGLTRRDPEEDGVELGRVVEEPALTYVALADGSRVGVVQVLVPASVGGELRHRVSATVEQAPQLLGRGHAAGEAAAHPHDHDRVVGNGDRGGRLFGHRLFAEEFGAQEVGDLRRGRVVEDQRRRKAELGLAREAVAQLQGDQRVDARLAEGTVEVDAVRVRVAEDDRDVLADQVHDLGGRLGGGKASSRAASPSPCRVLPRRAVPVRRPGPQQRRRVAEPRDVQTYCQEQRLTGSVGGVEQRQA